MKDKDFTYSFSSSKSSEEIFRLLLQIPQWWTGFYEETIKGKSERTGDEFSFAAGGGAHYSEQKLVELIPNKKLVWLVTDSNLSFLKDTAEWNGTKIGFDIAAGDSKTLVTFSHRGLVPQIECYEACSSAWAQYMQRLESKLQ